MGDPEACTQSLLLFHSCGLDCAFPLDAVREIVPMTMLSCPPGLPSGLAGFLDLRGTAIAIVRLDRLFDLAEQLPGLHTPIIVLRGALSPIGILAEFVRGVVPVAPLHFVEMRADRTFQGCTTAAIQIDGDLIHVLSPASLLEATEDRLVADYCAMAEARRAHFEERV
jgi:chemotaxis signal transduction protein